MPIFGQTIREPCHTKLTRNDRESIVRLTYKQITEYFNQQIKTIISLISQLKHPLNHGTHNVLKSIVILAMYSHRWTAACTIIHSIQLFSAFHPNGAF